MAATMWDSLHPGMESGESFQESGNANCEGICLGREGGDSNKSKEILNVLTMHFVIFVLNKVCI